MNCASGSMNLGISQGQATRSTFTRWRVTHFIRRLSCWLVLDVLLRVLRKLVAAIFATEVVGFSVVGVLRRVVVYRHINARKVGVVLADSAGCVTGGLRGWVLARAACGEEGNAQCDDCGCESHLKAPGKI